MRSKYRSAIYYLDDRQKEKAILAIEQLQKEFENKIITMIIPFNTFELNQETYLNYYQKNPNKPFCKTYISPKLLLLREKLGRHLKVI